MANPIFTNEKSQRSISEFEFLHNPNDKNAKLGVGSFASVKLAKEKKTGKQHAIKIICMEPSKITNSDLHNIRTEISIHRKLDHPNIIKFYDYIQKDHNAYLILDYAENGNLYSYLHKKKSLATDEIFRFFYQTCLAFQYLHQNDVLHRDLKPENLLLDKNRNIKLCDFGWATRRITEKRLTFCGTYEYMAPEIVHKKHYDYRVDIWSLGVLLYELIHREAPYKGRSLPEITKSLAKSQITFSPSINVEAKDLILKILKTNPSERLSIAQILSHPWVQSHLFASEEEDILQVEEIKMSPREMLAANFQSAHAELRRNHENFKSEIIISGNDILADTPSGSQTRKHSDATLFSSFNASSSLKEKEREKPKDRIKERERLRNKERMISTASTTMNSSGLQRRSPLAFNHSLKTADENILSSRGHAKSSSSIANNILEKLTLDEKISSSIMCKKKKIFENSILSPNFRTKVDNIIHKLSSHTTTHRTAEAGSSIYSAKGSSLNQQPMQAQASCADIPVLYRHYGDQNQAISQNLRTQLTSKTLATYRADENVPFTTSSSQTYRTKTDMDFSNGTQALSHMKNNSQKKISLTKGDNFSAYSLPTSNKNLTTRAKHSSEIDFDKNFTLSHKIAAMEAVRPLTSKHSANVLSITDQNKHKVHENIVVSLNKANKGSKKQGLKTSEELNSATLLLSSLSERRNENKENKREIIKDKENQMRLREECTGNWAY